MTQTVRLIILSLLALALVVFAFNVPIDGQDGAGLSRFIGRFHVLVLHFPVTLLLLAPALALLARLEKFKSLRPTVPLIWWLGSGAVFITVTMGLLLAANEGYAIDEVRSHMLGGISVALLAFLCTALATSSLNTRLKKIAYAGASTSLTLVIFIAAHAGGNLVHGETYLTRFAPEPVRSWLEPPTEVLALNQVDDSHYLEKIRPILQQNCFDCHGPDNQKAGVQLDILDPDFVNGHDAPHWHAALDMINSGEMPPKKKAPLSTEDRRLLVDWMTQGIEIAKQNKKDDYNTRLRRLSKSQYKYSLQDLLNVNVEFDKDLPDDPLSELGFSNNGELLQSSVLHLQTFEKIAREALDKAIAPAAKPDVHHYRVSFGKNIGAGQKHTKSVGYLDVTIPVDDFKVEMFDRNGNGTPLEGEQAAKILKYFSVSLRGSSRNDFVVEEDGIVLFSAKPHVEAAIAGRPGAWNAPSPNLSVQIKDQYPMQGDFAVRVKAQPVLHMSKAKPTALAWSGTPQVQLDSQGEPLKGPDKTTVVEAAKANKKVGFKFSDKQKSVLIPDGKAKNEAAFFVHSHKQRAQFYQLDLVHSAGQSGKNYPIEVKVGSLKKIKTQLNTQAVRQNGRQVTSLGILYLHQGRQTVTLTANKNFPGLSHLVLTPLTQEQVIANNLQPDVLTKPISQQRKPALIPYMGTRTDDGVDYKHFAPATVLNPSQPESEIYTFIGRMENMPIPMHGTVGDRITSSSLKVGVWNQDLVKSSNQAGSAIKVEYIEFEAPYYPQWPMPSHRQIFANKKAGESEPDYAKRVIHQFAERAFRRPLKAQETDRFYQLWQLYSEQFLRFEDSIKEALVAILCSPRFLYLAEPETQIAKQTPPAWLQKLQQILGINFAHAEQNKPLVDDYSLASRLSYFLWNSSPDEGLLARAKDGNLVANLSQEVDRMLDQGDKTSRFVNQFVYEWLRLDRQQMQNVDVQTYPDYTRFVKADMQQQTQAFFAYLLTENKSILNIIDSDFLMLNQNLAEFYGISGVQGNAFRPVPKGQDSVRGGLITQGAFLTGHGDGIHSHPVKRAVWLKSKIMGDEPPPPPPNVPEIDPDTPGFAELTLKQQLELHRDKDSCRDCHAKIDPYGVVFEGFDGVGRTRTEFKGKAIDTFSVMPDGTELTGVTDLKNYLTQNQEQVVKSLIKHLYSYALGKDVSFHDSDELEAIYQKVKDDNYQMQSLIKAIVQSPSFIQV
ncbi:DUF1592 domain-containing protein [Gayadomonas joobiniege]|uniref:DUF1592 domain-containing protein n=1 Tax=Gayadomonas joobiniege TaxID=1234606 RepID=UPI000363268F|nr:DUF1592 domain-containing protein [Gayadomonas joobiniege]